MDKAFDSKQQDKQKEILAMEVAKNKTNVAQWGLNVAILLFGLMITTIILVSLGVDITVTTITALSGLLIVWLIGRARGRQLYQRFYIEELERLQQEPDDETASLVSDLTYREIQILHFAALGYANKRIANELGISENTVKHFVSNILTKLDASDRTEAAVIAIKNRIIPIKIAD